VAQARRRWFATTVSLSQRNFIYNAQSKDTRWGAALSGNESSIPMIDADFPDFALKIVETFTLFTTHLKRNVMREKTVICHLSGYLRSLPNKLPRGPALSVDGFCHISWPDIIFFLRDAHDSSVWLCFLVSWQHMRQNGHITWQKMKPA
jgi:hypothetical protein